MYIKIKTYCYHIFLQNVVTKIINISAQFVGIKCLQYDLTLKTVNREIEHRALRLVLAVVANTSFHQDTSCVTAPSGWLIS